MAKKTKIDYEATRNKKIFIAVSVIMGLIVLAVMGFVWLIYSNADSIYGSEDEPLSVEEAIDNDELYSEGISIFVEGNITEMEDSGARLDDLLLVRMSSLEKSYFYVGQTVIFEIEKGEHDNEWYFVEVY